MASQPIRTAKTDSVEIRFEAVYRSHVRRTWSLLKRLGVPSALLDDASQDVFMVVNRKLDQVKGPDYLRAWLYGIALRVASEYRRRTKKSQSAPLPENLCDPAPSPARVSELRQEVELHLLLDKMDDDKRTVFVLVEIEQLNVPDVAELLDTKLNTVYSRLRLARKQFETDLLRHKAGELRTSGACL